MSVMVFQAKQPTFFAKKTSVTVREMMNDYAMVARVETSDLNVAYRLTNTIDQSWWLNESVEFRGSPDHGMEGCRSTSVGDIMVRENGETGTFNAYIVSSCGFRELDQI